LLRETGSTFAAKPVERLFHDNDNRVIAEVNASGTTVREYIWMDDLPVAVLDGTTSTANPTLFFVHADHLNRPVAMSNAAKAWVWRAQYEPFGAVHQIVGPAANDSRFPGQWFQLEAGLAYNWHRHYDATLGRYTQGDPLGLKTLRSDGPSVYGYVGQSPLMWVDNCASAKILADRVPRQSRAPLNLPDRHPSPETPAPDDAQ
jgi:RHS repeat-associated protein